MSFNLLEILCRIYVPFVYRERFRIISCFRRISNLITRLIRSKPILQLWYFIWMTSRWFIDAKTNSSLPIPFLTNYIPEKIIRTSMSSVLRPFQHIFLDYIRLYHETSSKDLKFSEAYTFEKARLLGIELRWKPGMTRNLSRYINST